MTGAEDTAVWNAYKDVKRLLANPHYDPFDVSTSESWEACHPPLTHPLVG